jgi:ribosomal protein L11 methyltransferase
VRVTVRASAHDAPAVLAEACDLLGAGCRERADVDGRVALDFWLPTKDAPTPARVRARLAERGLDVAVSRAREGEEWRHALRRFHRPVEVAGRLLVRPPWAPPRAGLLDVVIDPGMAFGTGQHPTTSACLQLLCELPPASLADVGCGSGVLAIAARRLGHDPVWALDADALAVEAALANARANGVGIGVARREVGRDRLPRADARRPRRPAIRRGA